jgi:hypothetical protein
MKKLFLILCLFSITAHAEWKFFGSTDTFTSYIDYSRIKTEGRYKSIWDLFDYKSPQTEYSGKQYKSSVAKEIVDCQASRSQLVALYFYSEQMGKGEVVSSGNFQVRESEWSNPPPNSIGDDLIKIACSSR